MVPYQSVVKLNINGLAAVDFGDRAIDPGVIAGTLLQTEMFGSRRVLEDVLDEDPSLSSTGHTVAAGSSLRLRLHHDFHGLGGLLHTLKKHPQAASNTENRIR